MSPATLYVGATPLWDQSPLPPTTLEAARRASVIVGENRKTLMPQLKDLEGKQTKEFFWMDPPRPEEREAMLARIKVAAQKGESVLLVSDTGLPMLFDPGAEVLQACQALGFTVRSCEGATSWGSACALSGWEPPFLIQGFPPRKKEELGPYLHGFRSETAHLLWMDTPYRFQSLLEACEQAFPKRQGFLAWNLSHPTEHLLWGSLSELRRLARERGLEKGEFILLVKGAGR